MTRATDSCTVHLGIVQISSWLQSKSERDFEVLLMNNEMSECKIDHRLSKAVVAFLNHTSKEVSIY